MKSSKTFMLLTFLILSGCATGPQLGKLKSPEPNVIMKYVEDFSEFQNTKISTAQDYLFSGFVYVDHHCENFFVGLELRRRQLKFARKGIGASLNQAGSLANVTIENLSNLSLAAQILVGLSQVADSTLDSFDENFNYAKYSAPLRRLTMDAKSQFKNNALQRLNFKKEGESTADKDDFLNKITFKYKNNQYVVVNMSAFLISHSLIQDYARLCTIAQFELFIEQSLNQANVAGQFDNINTKVVTTGVGNDNFYSTLPKLTSN